MWLRQRELNRQGAKSAKKGKEKKRERRRRRSPQMDTDEHGFTMSLICVHLCPSMEAAFLVFSSVPLRLCGSIFFPSDLGALGVLAVHPFRATLK
jgi:hypothetical protein